MFARTQFPIFTFREFRKTSSACLLRSMRTPSTDDVSMSQQPHVGELHDGNPEQ